MKRRREVCGHFFTAVDANGHRAYVAFDLVNALDARIAEHQKPLPHDFHDPSFASTNNGTCYQFGQWHLPEDAEFTNYLEHKNMEEMHIAPTRAHWLRVIHSQ